MGRFPHASTLVLEYDDATDARIVERSVAREVGEIDGDRSRATVERDGAAVTLELAARDLTALRAAGNTWLTLAEVAERAAAIGERHR